MFAHVDAAAHVLPLVLVHLEGALHRAQIDVLARGAVEIAIAFQRGEQRGMRVVARVVVNRALVPGDDLFEPPGFLVVVNGRLHIGPFAVRRVVLPGIRQNALKAQVQILHIREHAAGIEVVAHAACQLEGARLARIARVQQAKGDPGARVIGVFLGFELVAGDGDEKAVFIPAGIDFRHDGAHHLAQFFVFPPQQRSARAHQKFARGLPFEVVFKVPVAKGIGHARRVFALVHSIPVEHAVEVETLEKGDVVFKHALKTAARQAHAAHGDLEFILHGILFHKHLLEY